MSKLSVFLRPAVPQQEQEVIISNRFLDASGQPVPFKIRAITQEENEMMTRLCRKPVKLGGQTQEVLDSVEFSRRLAVAAVVFPDFKSQELCQAYGVLDPMLVPGKMLLSGEFSKLMRAISELSGFDNEDIPAQAKN